MNMALACCAVLLLSSAGAALGFATAPILRNALMPHVRPSCPECNALHRISSHHQRRSHLGMTSKDADSNNDDSSKNDEDAFQQQFQARAVEVTRDSLEHQNLQSLLKRKPIKLPYNVARRWVQANLGASTQEEFDDLVANGNVRTPYIPKQPEAYYTSTREWISWDHFLTGMLDDAEPSAIKPQTGIFD